jgi:hypothetical protein
MLKGERFDSAWPSSILLLRHKIKEARVSMTILPSLFVRFHSFVRDAKGCRRLSLRL